MVDIYLSIDRSIYPSIHIYIYWFTVMGVKSQLCKKGMTAPCVDLLGEMMGIGSWASKQSRRYCQAHINTKKTKTYIHTYHCFHFIYIYTVHIYIYPYMCIYIIHKHVTCSQLSTLPCYAMHHVTAVHFPSLTSQWLDHTWPMSAGWVVKKNVYLQGRLKTITHRIHVWYIC